MIYWKAHAKCDHWNCKAETEVTITLKAERHLEITEPEGWRVRHMPSYDSYPDVNSASNVDLNGAPMHIYCPEHDPW